MKKGLSFQRIMGLVLVSVLLTALIILAVYSVVTPRILADTKLSELYPRAMFLSDQASLYFSGRLSASGLDFLGMDSRQWGASVWIYDDQSHVVAKTDAHVGFLHSDGNESVFKGLLNQIYAGDGVSQTVRLEVPREGEKSQLRDHLLVGVPIQTGGAVKGAVIMVSSMDDVNSVMTSLLSTISFAVITVVLCMLPFVFLYVQRLTRPLQDMQEVALRIAAGEYTAKADPKGAGEYADLARALNLLSSELSERINDLRHERNQALSIINSIGDGILAVDVNCAIMQINPALQALQLAAGHGRKLPLPPEVLEEFRTALTERRTTETNFQMGEVYLRLIVTPIGELREGYTSAIGVFHNETQAYDLEQTRREYVANVSHELRTPLTALRALIEPLRDGMIQTEEKRLEIYDVILRETMRLSRLVDDMLELSRLQSGKLALEKIRFQVAPMLHDIASIYAAKAGKTGHVLSLEIASKPLPAVYCNPDRAEQVLVALLNNAFSYTPSGSHVVIRAEAREEYLLISVEDDGPGISPAALAHVFERFYKEDKSHSSGGTGLGLAISMEVMQRLGETLTAANRITGGACFSFTLHYI